MPILGGMRYFVPAIIALSTLARVLWALDTDPLMGPDSATYHHAAIAITQHGPFSTEIPAVPYWPVGYPAVVAFLYEMFGIGTRAVGVVQALAVGGAALAVYSTRRVFGTASLVAAVLLSVNTALFGASGLLMYEPLLAGVLAWAAVLVMGRKPRAIIGFGLLGIASVIQPKCLLVGVAFLIWVAMGNRKVAALSLVAFVALPAVVSISNLSNYGSLSLSANLGSTMRIGFNDQADGTYDLYTDEVRAGCEQKDGVFEQDRSMTGCALGWAVRNPLAMPKLTAMKAAAFWSPFTGPLTARSTWATPVDIRTKYPAYWTDNPTFEAVDTGLGHLFVGVGVLLASVGAWSLGKLDRDRTLFWLAPVAVFLLVTLGTIGDARFRLPVAPFYLLLQGQALVFIARKVLAASPTFQRYAEMMPQPSVGSISSKGAV